MRIHAVLLACLLAPSLARADSWAPFRPFDRVSADGTSALHVGERAFTWTGGRGGATHGGRLNRTPADGDVLDGAAGFVLFDTYASLGSGTLVDRYTAEGEVVWSHTLESLFEPDRAAAFPRSISSTWWCRDWWIDEPAGLVVLSLNDAAREFSPAPPPGTLLSLRIQDGAPAETPVAVLTRRLQAGHGGYTAQAIDLGADSRWLRDTCVDDAVPLGDRVEAERRLAAQGGSCPTSVVRWTIDHASELLTPDPTDPQDPQGQGAQRAVAEALRSLVDARGGKALPELLALARSGEQALAHLAVGAMKPLAPSVPAGQLRRWLGPGEPTALRWLAAQTLGASGQRRWVPVLMAYADDLGIGAVAAAAALPGGAEGALGWAAGDADRSEQLARASRSRPLPPEVLLGLLEGGLLGNRTLTETIEALGEDAAPWALAQLRADPSNHHLLRGLPATPAFAAELLRRVDGAAAGSGPLAEGNLDAWADALGRVLDGPDELTRRLREGQGSPVLFVLALRSQKAFDGPDRATSVVALTAALDRDDLSPGDRRRLIEIVVRERVDEAAPVAARYLAQDADEDLAITVAMYLKRVGGDWSGAQLAAMLRHPRGRACRSLLHTLGEPGPEHAQELRAVFRAGGIDCVGRLVGGELGAEDHAAMAAELERRVQESQRPREANRTLDESALELVEWLADVRTPEVERAFQSALSYRRVRSHRSNKTVVAAAATALLDRGSPWPAKLCEVLGEGTHEDGALAEALRRSRPLPPSCGPPLLAALARADANSDPGEEWDVRFATRELVQALARVAGLDEGAVYADRLLAGRGPLGALAKHFAAHPDPRAAPGLRRALDEAPDSAVQRDLIVTLLAIDAPQAQGILARAILAQQGEPSELRRLCRAASGQTSASQRKRLGFDSDGWVAWAQEQVAGR